MHKSLLVDEMIDFLKRNPNEINGLLTDIESIKFENDVVSKIIYQLDKKNKKTEKKIGFTPEKVKENEVGIITKYRYDKFLIVCSNGHTYRKRKDGLYYLIPTELSKTKNYLTISIDYNGKKRSLLAHRVIAETFLPNPNNLETVNHIDGNRENNSIENLEWCSQRDNIRHMVNMHKQKYLTNLKKKRVDSGITTIKIARKIGLMLGRYRDIENAVKLPNEEERGKIEKYFGDSIENLLMKAEEDNI